jgi:hypothetical protein
MLSNALPATFFAQTTCVTRSATNVAVAAVLALRGIIATQAPTEVNVVRLASSEPPMGIVRQTGSNTAVKAILVRPVIVAAPVAVPETII